LRDFFEAYSGKVPTTVQFGRLALGRVDQRELTELCAEQFLVRARSA